MRKLYILLLILLFFTTNIYSQQITIYDYVKLIQRNPRLYIIVPGAEATQSELNIVADLSKALDVRKIYKETEIGSLGNNLIIIGSSSTNKKIRYSGLDSAMGIYGTNLILSGSPSQLKNYVNLLKNPEINQKALSVNKLISSKEFLSPLSDLTFLMNSAYTLLCLTIVTFIILVMFKSMKKPQTNYSNLDTYIKNAVDKGYSKEQIKDSLTKAGWSNNVIDNEFKKIQ